MPVDRCDRLRAGDSTTDSRLIRARARRWPVYGNTRARICAPPRTIAADRGRRARAPARGGVCTEVFGDRPRGLYPQPRDRTPPRGSLSRRGPPAGAGLGGGASLETDGPPNGALCWPPILAISSRCGCLRDLPPPGLRGSGRRMAAIARIPLAERSAAWAGGLSMTLQLPAVHSTTVLPEEGN
jgi:hypothetical protein